MRKTFPLLLLATVLTANAAAQSGRRNVNPPTPVEPAMQPPLASSERERLPPAPMEMRALPENLLSHQIKALEKGSFSFADFGGKVIVINLWASWCGPCRMEIPEYEKVRKDYAARGVEFIGLTTEDPRTSSDKVSKFVRDAKFNFRLGWADPQIARTLMNGRSGIPQTLVIAADGRIVSHWTGYSRGQGGDRLRQTLDHALSEGSSPARRFQ